ncbi:MAG TPA: DEAD/DEAH box helicase [archaeon]|nr:DEAD/DEAH box helicase [archaeon]
MNFEEFKLSADLLKAIKDLGYEEATPIQEKCIPLALEGRDLIGQSLTGSGKTAAFGLPILNNITLGLKGQVLILTPTRELAQQVKENIDSMAKYTKVRTVCVFGGVGYEWQIKGAQQSEIIVATPGRLLDHIKQGTIKLTNIKIVVIDEADRMLDMGFEKDVDRILQMTPKKRQTIMFSATMPDAAKKMASRYLKNPEHIKEKLHVDVSKLNQIFYSIIREKKFSLLVHLLKNKKGTAIVFCRTKREVDKVTRNLRKQGLEVMGVHGDISQNKRMYAVSMFKEGNLDALIATDVAARGLDIKNVSHVYNYDVPKDPDDYTHRIGRTARAGAVGEAITLVSEREGREFSIIMKRAKIKQEPTPEFEQLVLMKTDHMDDREDRGYRGGRRSESHYPRREFGGNKNHSGGNYSQRPRFTRGPRPSFGRSERPSYGGNSPKNYGTNSTSGMINEEKHYTQNTDFANKPFRQVEDYPKKHFNPRPRRYDDNEGYSERSHSHYSNSSSEYGGERKGHTKFFKNRNKGKKFGGSKKFGFKKRRFS